MKDYSKGKIYKIINDENDKFYIGSTIQKLCDRMTNHRTNKKFRCAIHNLGLDLYKCSIILIEKYPCKDNEELRKKEREYFDKYKKECKALFLNIRRPIITKEEKRELHRIKATEWNNKNKEKHDTYQNSEERKEYRKKRYEQNKEELKKKGSIQIMCECGKTLQKRNFYNHKKTKIHLAYLALIN
tara:strand:+ start:3115 stop:3672 length:558 start_codon:yes stop_codon:yes gene_type:complete